MFQRTLRSESKIVKDMIESSPESSSTLTGVPRFCTLAATRLVGWEFMTIVEGVGEVSEERGIQETLLHVAVRVGCVELAVFFMEKGMQIDMDLIGHWTDNLRVLFCSKTNISTVPPIQVPHWMLWTRMD